jgi:hypothetical protein
LIVRWNFEAQLGVRKAMKLSRPILALALLATLVPLSAIGQRRGELPHALRTSLDARLFSFTQAQATGQWDQVKVMLGRYRRGGTGDHLYIAIASSGVAFCPAVRNPLCVSWCNSQLERWPG